MPATRGAALLIALALCGCGVSDTGQPLGQSTGQPADQSAYPSAPDPSQADAAAYMPPLSEGAVVEYPPPDEFVMPTIDPSIPTLTPYPTLVPTQTPTPLPVAASDDEIGFVLRVGCNSLDLADAIDGFANEYVQRTTIEGQHDRVPLTFTDADRQRILDEANNIGFWAYPASVDDRDAPQNGTMMQSPVSAFMTYELTIRYRDMLNTVQWSDMFTDTYSPEAAGMRTIVAIINEMAQRQLTMDDLPMPQFACI